MKTLYLFKALPAGGRTLSKCLTYDDCLSDARAKAERIFNRDYPNGYEFHEGSTQVFTDPLVCENSIGSGQGIVGTLYKSDLLLFLRDFAVYCKGKKRRHGSGFEKEMAAELTYQETLERRKLIENDSSRTPGRSLDLEETRHNINL